MRSIMQTGSITADFDAALNENQAAQFLGVSVRTLQAWRVRGGGPRYVKIGRAVRYQRGELISFQRAHTVSSTSEADAKGGGL
jgi:predicted DNA-binding transcriptional regulator AlpA